MQRACDESLKWFVRNAYAPFLEVAIGNRWLFLSAALGILVLAAGMIRSGMTPFSLFPKVDSTRIQARITFPDGTPASITEEAIARLERALDDTAAKLGAGGPPLVTLVHASIGAIQMQGKPGVQSTSSGSNLGAVSVELEESTKRTVTSETFLTEWRRTVGTIPGADSLGPRPPDAAKFLDPNAGAADDFDLEGE